MKKSFYAAVVVTFLLTQIGWSLTSMYYDGMITNHIETVDEDSFAVIDIEFAVYDTENSANMDELLADGLTDPQGGRYVYAYQLFNNPDFGDSAITYFSILDIAGEAIDESLMSDTQAQDDGSGGISPHPQVSEDQGVWEWVMVSEGGHGYVAKGQNSWVLVLTSDSDWTAGTFEVRAVEDGDSDLPVPVPEPTTIMLIGLGGALSVLLKRQNLS